MEQKTCQVRATVSGGKRRRNVLRFDSKELREGFCRRGTGGRPFHVKGPKAEKALELTVKRGIWRLSLNLD